MLPMQYFNDKKTEKLVQESLSQKAQAPQVKNRNRLLTMSFLQRRSLDIVFWNCRSAYNKLFELKLFVYRVMYFKKPFLRMIISPHLRTINYFVKLVLVGLKVMWPFWFSQIWWLKAFNLPIFGTSQRWFHPFQYLGVTFNGIISDWSVHKAKLRVDWSKRNLLLKAVSSQYWERIVLCLHKCTGPHYSARSCLVQNSTA